MILKDKKLLSAIFEGLCHSKSVIIDRNDKNVWGTLDLGFIPVWLLLQTCGL